jgi:hypothetical protein
VTRFAAGAVWAALVIWQWRRWPRTRMGMVFVNVALLTNLVLIDRGVPIGERLIPPLVAGAIAVVVFTGWRLWRDAREKS